MNIKGLCCRAALVGMQALWADAPSWPSDFDSKLAAHVAAVQPKGDAVGGETLASFDSFAFASAPSPSFGTEASPFDSFWMRFVWTEGAIIDGRELRGTIIILK